ncbi:Protein of unknown function [Halobacillus karajensis]|nr:Protein of unknown function [Halobacillus karajensis]
MVENLYTYIVSFGHFSSWYKLVIGEPTKIIPYTMMFLGAYMLVLGIENLKKEEFIHRVHSSCRWGFYASYQRLLLPDPRDESTKSQ